MDIEECTSDPIKDVITNCNEFIDEILDQLESDFEELEKHSMFESFATDLGVHINDKVGKRAQRSWLDHTTTTKHLSNGSTEARACGSARELSARG